MNRNDFAAAIAQHVLDMARVCPSVVTRSTIPLLPQEREARYAKARIYKRQAEDMQAAQEVRRVG